MVGQGRLLVPMAALRWVHFDFATSTLCDSDIDSLIGEIWFLSPCDCMVCDPHGRSTEYMYPVERDILEGGSGQRLGRSHARGGRRKGRSYSKRQRSKHVRRIHKDIRTPHRIGYRGYES